MNHSNDYREMFNEKFNNFKNWLEGELKFDFTILFKNENDENKEDLTIEEYAKMFAMDKLCPYLSLIKARDVRVIKSMIDKFEEFEEVSEDLLNQIDFFFDQPDNYEKFYRYLECFADLSTAF